MQWNLSRKVKFLLHASTVVLSNWTALHLKGHFQIQVHGSVLKTGDLTSKTQKKLGAKMEVWTPQ